MLLKRILSLKNKLLRSNFLLIVVILFSLFSCTDSDEYSMTLTVLDKFTTDPIENAVVTIVGQKGEYITDANGKCEITNLENGEVAVIVSHEGFEKESKEFTIKDKSKIFEGKISLHPKTETVVEESEPMPSEDWDDFEDEGLTAEFPGGAIALQQFIIDNVHYP